MDEIISAMRGFYSLEGDEETRAVKKSKQVGPGFSPDALEILFGRKASGLKPRPT